MNTVAESWTNQVPSWPYWKISSMFCSAISMMGQTNHGAELANIPNLTAIMRSSPYSFSRMLVLFAKRPMLDGLNGHWSIDKNDMRYSIIRGAEIGWVLTRISEHAFLSILRATNQNYAFRNNLILFLHTCLFSVLFDWRNSKSVDFVRMNCWLMKWWTRKNSWRCNDTTLSVVFQT